MIVFLDTGILSQLSSINETQQFQNCQNWLYGLLARGIYVVSSDICDYEVRRGLILISITKNKAQDINQLDSLHQMVDFLPVSQDVLKKAAQLWAETRSKGKPTADIKNIDADVIIGATCQLLQTESPGQFLVVATTNVKHISQFALARIWQDIQF